MASVTSTSPAEIDDKTIAVYGQTIHYLESGLGPNVILLHGLGGDAAEWRTLMGELGRHYHVIALDLLGFGLSDKPLLAYRVSLFSDVLARFLRNTGTENAVVVGNSMGGWVAAWFAAQYPTLVNKLALLNAIGLGSYQRSLTPLLTTALRQATKSDLRLLGQLAYYDQSLITEEFIDTLFEARLRAGDGYTVNQLVDSLSRGEDALDSHLTKIVSPTAVIWGGADRLVELGFGDEFHRSIVNSQFHVIEHCGHMPHMECPGKLAVILRGFFDVGIICPSYPDA